MSEQQTDAEADNNRPAAYHGGTVLHISVREGVNDLTIYDKEDSSTSSIMSMLCYHGGNGCRCCCCF